MANCSDGSLNFAYAIAHEFAALTFNVSVIMMTENTGL